MVFISTCCLNGTDSGFIGDIFKVLDKYAESGIENIELGSCHKHPKNLQQLFEFRMKHKARFIVHCHFPAAKQPIMMNFASQNKELLKKSLAVARNAIEIANMLDAEIYGIHGGFLVDFNTDLCEISENTTREKAFETMEHSIGEVCDFASKYGIKVAVENMHDQDNILFSKVDDFIELFKRVSARNLFVLLDIGHLARASAFYGFDKREFIRELQDKIVELHIHQTVNGKDHLPINDKHILDDFEKEFLRKTAVTLEAHGMTIEQILENKKIIEETIQ